MAPLGLGYFIWSEVTHRRRTKEAAEQNDVPADAPPARASSKRAQARADLQRASSGSAVAVTTRTSDAAGIGHGPDTTSSEAAVRDKLSRRYGG